MTTPNPNRKPLRSVPLSELPDALTEATDAEVKEFYLKTTGHAMSMGTFYTDPYRLAAYEENHKREIAAFRALPPHLRTPDADRN